MAFDLATAKPLEEAPKVGGFDLKTAQPMRDPKWVPDSGMPAAEQPKRFLGGPEDREMIWRQIGLTARSGAQSIADLAGLPGLIVDRTADLVGVGGPRFDTHQTVSRSLSNLGLPEPKDAVERVSQDVAGGMVGAGGMVKGAKLAGEAGNALVQRVGQAMAERAGTQVVSGATGGAAAGVTREAGGGPVAQILAGAGGGAVPAVPALAAAATRAAMRGGEAGRVRMQNNIDTFEDAGAGTPSVGQATESRGNRAIESVLSKTPGSSGRMAAKADEEAAGLGAKVEGIASNLAGPMDAARAGRRIRGGLEQFVSDFKGQSGKLYDELDKHIPRETQVGVSNTRIALEKLNADIPGAPELSKWFKNAKIQGIEGALDKDAPATQAQPIISQILDQAGKNIVAGETPGKVGGIPYEALKKLRTLVGNEISDSTIASDVPRSKWSPLYAALSKDMAAAAQGAGPKAEAAFVRANNFHRSGMQRLDDVIGPILKKGDPEDVFKAALSGSQEGASTIHGVMKSLPVESKKAVAATMLQRLGKANPSKQNELGEVFSTESFLTNWNKLHPDAKRSLFGTLSPEMRTDLDKIAKVAGNAREGSKVFANPPGTAAATTSNLTAGAFALSVLTGQWHAAGGIVAGVGSANLGARAMTSPKVVHWLAESTKVPVEQLPAQLNQLFQASLYMKGDERREVRQFVKDVREARTAAAQPQAAVEAGVP